jgi:hypothetical protein
LLVPVALVVVLAAPAARAADGSDDDGAVNFKAGQAASVGAFLPLSQAASIEGVRAYAVGLAGYDSARQTGTFEASTEVRLFGPVSVRGGAVYTSSTRSLRPSFGARVQALREARAGVDLSLGAFYRPEGLTEPEGEIESVLSVGRHVGSSYLLGNLLYGQDPDGHERDGEVRLAALRPVGPRWIVGLDSRGRFDLGSDRTILAQHMESTFDAVAGPLVTAVLKPVALSLQAGGSATRMPLANTRYGAFVMTGIGTAF